MRAITTMLKLGAVAPMMVPIRKTPQKKMKSQRNEKRLIKYELTGIIRALTSM